MPWRGRRGNAAVAIAFVLTAVQPVHGSSRLAVFPRPAVVRMLPRVRTATTQHLDAPNVPTSLALPNLVNVRGILERVQSIPRGLIIHPGMPVFGRYVGQGLERARSRVLMTASGFSRQRFVPTLIAACLVAAWRHCLRNGTVANPFQLALISACLVLQLASLLTVDQNSHSEQ